MLMYSLCILKKNIKNCPSIPFNVYVQTKHLSLCCFINLLVKYVDLILYTTIKILTLNFSVCKKKKKKKMKLSFTALCYY